VAISSPHLRDRRIEKARKNPEKPKKPETTRSGG